MSDGHVPDDLWSEFVREYAKGDAIHEPSAAERAAVTRRLRRRRTTRLLGALCALAVVLAGVGYWFSPLRPGSRTGTSHGSPASSGPSPSAHGASASPTPSAGGGTTGSAAAVTRAVPLTVFPAAVKGYTRVGEAAVRDCEGADQVGPALAAFLRHGHGCLGVDVAMYKDAGHDEFNLALFTLKDPSDAAAMAAMLASKPTDYEVAVQQPPAGSGLRRLPADSGLVQAFAGSRHTVLVGMAQWPDGRAADYGALTAKLTPLDDAVMRHVTI